jgi:hypothetical protein
MIIHDWSEVKTMVNVIGELRLDLPDGMWEKIKEQMANYKATNKTDNDKNIFIRELNNILIGYGYQPIATTQEQNV